MKNACTYCGAVSECSCPEGSMKHAAEAKYACPVCIELMSMGVKEDELKTSDKRDEARKQVIAGSISEGLANAATEAHFEEIWRQEKEILRELSKKDIAEESFFQGLRTGIAMMLEAHREGKLQELVDDALEESRQAH